MNGVLRHPGRNPRLISALHGLTGALLIASNLVHPSVDSLEVGGVFVLIGGGTMIALGIGGVLRPSEWGSTTEYHGLAWVYALTVLLFAIVVFL